jgi:DNA-binding winged helix-turn-helix (wHTH) protein
MSNLSVSVSRSTIRDSVRTWLTSWDFVDNPFAYWEASQEAWLERYYVRRPFFTQLLNDHRSIIAYAKRGGGKSATRIMLESECRPKVGNSPVLAVSFTNFAPLIRKFTIQGSLYIDDYLPFIVSEVLEKLIETIVRNPQIIPNLSSIQINELSWWITTYSKQLYSKSSLKKLLLLADRDINDTTLREAVFRIQRKENLELKNKKAKKILDLLIKLHSASPEKPFLKLETAKNTILELTDLTFEILNHAPVKCQAVYFLVDGIDEHPETLNSPQLSAAILSPLLGENEYLEKIPNFASKFFLPLEQKEAFESEYRTDRIEIINLEWDQNQLEELRILFRRRISAFNTRGLISLAELCHPSIRRWIEDAMLEESKGSPRNLLRLGDLILLEHCKEGSDLGSIIMPKEWEKALAIFRSIIGESDSSATRLNVNNTNLDKITNENKKDKSSTPKLRVDVRSGKVFRGKQQLENLPNLQFRLLKYLYLNRDRICEKNEIALAVYDLNYDVQYNLRSIEQDISKLISRLKVSIEIDNSNPIYIITIRGRGYKLENAE